jgi:hypothetical protein
MLVTGGIALAGIPAGMSSGVKAAPPSQATSNGAGQSSKPATNGRGAATGNVQLAPPAAPNVVLYDQYNNNADSGSNSQEYEAAHATYDDQVADDFIVPGGQQWTINEVDFQGRYFNGNGPAVSFNVYFYQNGGTLPATPVYTETALTYTSTFSNFVVSLTSPAILNGGPGTTYWVSVQARQDYDTAGQFGWDDRTVQSNNGAAFRNPGGGFACMTNDWLRKIDCAMTTQPDQVFRLVGTLVGGATPTQTATGTATTTPTTLSTATPTACAITFTDVPPGSTFYPYVHCLACLGIINGYPDGTFHPNANVTRGQLSKIVSNSAGFHDNQTTQIFADVPAGSTFFQYIGRLASRGYISGYPCGVPPEICGPGNLPFFRPNNNATRGQISKIDSSAAGFNDPPSGQQFEDVPVGSTFYTYTYRLVSRGVMSGYPCGGAGEPCVPPANLPYFRPNNNATRGQTSKIVSNTFFPDCSPPR